MKVGLLGTLLLVATVFSACTDHAPTYPGIRASQTASTSVTVTSANPNTAPQDTTINSHVYGSGFDRGSKAQWAQNGVPSPNVKTNSTQYVSSTELIANITIASVATAGSYDIAVTTSNGIKGIGSELFIVSTRPVASVAVSPSNATMASTSTLGFTATTYDHAGKVLTGRLVTWTSSNTAAATVSAAGLVTAQAAGSATITATSEGVSGTAAITVTAIPTGTLSFSALSTGSKHTCALAAGGAAYCWGFNYYGELGNGTTTTSPQLPTPLPGAVLGGLTFSAISGGYWATCAIATNGAGYCWGQNVSGLFGNGSGTNSLTPVPGANGLILAAVAQGDQHTCGLTAGGIAYCWGWNHYGQLGNGTTTDSPLPVAVSGGLTFKMISTSGPADQNCGLVADGTAYCWGLTPSGQSITPVPVSGGVSFATISTGATHDCGVGTTGLAFCWGDNTNGALGNGTTTNSAAPVAVSGGLIFTSVSVGYRFACGVTASGAAYCWGSNDHGQLGDGTNVNRTTPVAVLGGIQFALIGTGTRHSCGLTAGGVAYCWGQNLDGRGGNGATADSWTPVKVAYQP
jgi:alpha-tubulin suppressor-like RCC1 family protein